MFNKKFYVFTVILLLIAGCSKSPNDHLSYIPNEADLIIASNLGQILTKMNYEKLNDSEFFQEITRELRKGGAPSIVTKTIKDPRQLGLDIDRPIYFFSEGLNSWDHGAQKAHQFIKQLESTIDYKTKFKTDYTNLVNEKRSKGVEYSNSIISFDDLKTILPTSLDFSFADEWDVTIETSYSSSGNTYTFYINKFRMVSNDRFKYGRNKIIACSGNSRHWYDYQTFSENWDNYGRRGLEPIPVNFGMAIPISDYEVFKDRVDLVLNLLPEDQIKDTKTDDYHYFKYSEGIPDIAIGYNNDVFIGLMYNKEYEQYNPDNWTEKIESLLDKTITNKEIQNKPGIKNLEDKDLALWADLASLEIAFQEVASEIPTGGDAPDIQGILNKSKAGFQDNYFTSGLSFENGLVSLNVETFFNDVLSRIYSKAKSNKKIGNAIVNLFPDDAIAGAGGVVPLDELPEMIEKGLESYFPEGDKELSSIEERFDITISEASSILSGVVFGALYDIDLKREEVDYSVAVEIGNNTILNKLIKNVIDKFDPPQSMKRDLRDFEEGETVLIERGLLSIYKDKNYIYLSSPSMISDMKSKNKDGSLNNVLPQKPSGSSVYGFAHVSKLLRKMPEPRRSDEKMIYNFFDDLRMDIFDIGLDYKNKSIAFFMNLRFKETESNVLSTFSDSASDLLYDLSN